jgi:hypothetical protein
LIDGCLEIDRLASPRARKYSICTLVNDHDEYESFLASFQSGGFSTDVCEYIYADNSAGNKYDAYAAYNAFLLAATGEYVVLCHQDVLLIKDGRAELDRVIEEMNAFDPDWAVLGNAGGTEEGELAIRISDPHGEDTRRGALPARVQTLDENFMVVRRSANLALSHDLSGFHFYGTDICMIAAILGYRAYVVDFHLRHKSGGAFNDTFFEGRRAVYKKYEATLRPRWVRTTVTDFFISKSEKFNALVNGPLAQRFVGGDHKKSRSLVRWLRFLY